MKIPKTVCCPIFGKGCELKPNVLPTFNECMKQYIVLKDVNGRHVNVLDALVAKVMAIWNKLSVPILSPQRIKEKLKNYVTKYQTILKPYQREKGNRDYRAKLKTFFNESCSLFDVQACKCDLRSDCHCSVARSITNFEKQFLEDQCTERKMVLVEIDLNVPHKLNSKNRIEKENRSFDYENPSCDTENPCFESENLSIESENPAKVTEIIRPINKLQVKKN